MNLDNLDDICKIGQDALNRAHLSAVGQEERRAEPVHEICSFGSGFPLSEEMVRAVIGKVMEGLAALPPGTRTKRPDAFNIGGVEQKAIYRSGVALSFRLQAGTTLLQTVLHVGGYIPGEAEKAMTGH